MNAAPSEQLGSVPPVMDHHAAGVTAADIADVATLRALAHPVRLGIIRELAAKPETCACDFTELFGVRQPTISQHLRVLREAGLVRTRRRGTQICYSVIPEPIARLEQQLADLRGTPGDRREMR